MNPSASAGDTGSIPGLGRYPGERNGNLPQYSCLGNPMDRGAWQATDHEVTNESERSPKKGNGNPLQYSCLENSMDRGAWQATDHEIKKNQP